MKNKALSIVTAICLLLYPAINFAQAPNLGAATNFVLFSSVGAIGNTGISQITGNVGTNSGAISGFGNINGVMQNADATTMQAVSDLQAAYNYLDTITATSTHVSVLGNGETLFAGVHSLAAAGSIVGELTLDAQGNSSAIFIFRTGGALTTAASANVHLINGALACNVYWKSAGAISMATLTTMRGTLIANGAVDMGAGGTIEGRALSVVGAVSVYGTLAYIPMGCSRPALTGPLAPGLNTVSCFALFSAIGTVSNLGSTYVTGDVGTNTDSATGYNPLFVAGSVRPVPDNATAQCAIDLLALQTYIDSLPYDIELLYPAQLGNSLTLTPHTYRMNAAAALTDTLYLDAEGNVDAIFVIQVNAALTTSVNANVKLINGTQAKNVYWKVDGAVSINNNAAFAGTIVSGGAITLNSGVVLNGRALTTMGTVNTTAITANNGFGGACSILPVELLSFAATCDKQHIILKWSTATERKSHYFTVERSVENIHWQTLGTVEGKSNSSALHAYSYTDLQPWPIISYYRLKQTDFNGNYKYGNVVAIKKCGADAVENITLYPNPSAGKFSMLFKGDKTKIYSTEIFNAEGREIFKSARFEPTLDLTNQTPGIYFVYINMDSITIKRTIIIEKRPSR